MDSKLSNTHFDTSTAAEAPIGVSLADVKPEKVRWLWPGRIPYGKVTVIDGDPGLGKSLITTDLAARITTGIALPDGAQCEPGGVVLLSAEDGLADTIRPRLDAAHGDPAAVLSLAMVSDGGDERPTSIPEDNSLIERAIKQVDAKLVIIDPLMAFLSGTTNAHRDQDVRRALVPLTTLAEKTGVAVVVVRHLNKNSGGSALYRGGGSIGIIGTARSGLVVAADPEDEDRRVLAPIKHNLSKSAPGLVYTVETAHNEAAKVVWKGETNVKADALLNAPTDPAEKSALAEAKEWLRDELEDGPVAAKIVKENAPSAGISPSTLTRAKGALKVKSEKTSNGPWFWSLPEENKETT